MIPTGPVLNEENNLFLEPTKIKCYSKLNFSTNTNKNVIGVIIAFEYEYEYYLLGIFLDIRTTQTLQS